MITKELIKEFSTWYKQNPANAAVEHAVSKVGFKAASLDQETIRHHDFVFSDQIEFGKITNQEKSGRCWLFSGLNVSRLSVMNHLHIKDFQFSKTYPMFFDRLEKANTFLDNILETADLEPTSREVTSLLAMPDSDGGYWEFAVALLEKYGNVPESVMPETYNSKNSQELERLLSQTLRQDAVILRKMVKDGASEEELQAKKKEQLQWIYSLLVKALGQVPETFDYTYRDEDDQFHKLVGETPKGFFEKVVGFDLKDLVNVMNVPTEQHPMHETFSLNRVQNVKDAGKIHMVNEPIDVLKEAVVKSIKDGAPVWFACDVTAMAERDLGILDDKIYSYEDTLGFTSTLSKGDRLLYRMDEINHAMTFVGADIAEDGSVRNWKVENSWGEKPGQDGVFSMSDKWFDEHVYEVVVNKKYLSEEVLKDNEKDPIILDMWDPIA